MTIAASSGGGGGSAFFLIIIVAFVVLYLVVVRPQRKRQSQAQKLASGAQIGDEVLTAGGVYGRVTRLDDDDVHVEIAPKVEVRLARRAIAAVLTEHDEPEAPAEPAEDDEDGDERWQSAFDEGSEEKKPG
jgi:preprotein translocase subunit YajC